MNRQRALVRLHRMARRCGGVDAPRLHVWVGLLLRYALLAPLRLAQREQERRTPLAPLVEDPIFVLGHWRSGTTRLQEVLAADPRHTTSTLFTSLFADVSAAGAVLQAPMDAIASALGLPHSIQRQPLQLGLPAEGDIGLCLALLSEHAYTWGHLFPRAFSDWMDSHVLSPSPTAVEGWLADYDGLMRRVSALAGGRRVVMKSPGDTARVPLLLQRYPSAKFVYVHRDPIAVYHSTQYLWGVIRREFGLQSVTDEAVHRQIVSTYGSLLRRYLRDRESVPAGQLVEVRHERLVAEGPASLAMTYTTLQLGEVPGSVAAVLQGGRGHTAQRYRTSPELEQELRTAWAFAYDAWPEETS